MAKLACGFHGGANHGERLPRRRTRDTRLMLAASHRGKEIAQHLGRGVLAESAPAGPWITGHPLARCAGVLRDDHATLSRGVRSQIDRAPWADDVIFTDTVRAAEGAAGGAGVRQ